MTKLVFLTCVMLIGAFAQARYVLQDGGEVRAFSAENPAAMQPFTVKYSYKLVPFQEWSGLEKKVLNLHGTFQPDPENPMVMYIAKISFIVDKPATAVDLNRFLNIEMVRSLDPTIEQTIIDPRDVITYQHKEMAYRNPAAGRWCGDKAHTLCLNSLFTIPKEYQLAFALYERGRRSPYTTLEGQSELRIDTGGEIANAADLKLLTGLPTEPAGVLEQNVFWFTHGLEYIKVQGIVQPHPSEGNRSIITGYMVFGIEKKVWEMHPLGFSMKSLILSESGNTKDGILSGLPNMTHNLSLRLAEEIEH